LYFSQKAGFSAETSGLKKETRQKTSILEGEAAIENRREAGELRAYTCAMLISEIGLTSLQEASWRQKHKKNSL
jgi:hypothetical protein